MCLMSQSTDFLRLLLAMGPAPEGSPNSPTGFDSLDEVRDVLGDGLGEEWRDGVADLDAYFDPLPVKPKVVGESLKPDGFSMGDGAVSLGVEVSALLRFVELRANRDRRPVPP